MSNRSPLLFPLVLVACATPASGQVPPPTPGTPQLRVIHVTGNGRATAAPDSARVSIGVEAFAKSLERASEQANGDMSRVLSALKTSGVPEQDVRTSRYDVFVERPHDPQGRPGAPIGFRVTTSADVRIRDLKRLGATLDRVVSAGSNQIHSLVLEKADPSPEQIKALASAYEDARAKAAEIARAAKVKLGAVLSISESSGMGPPIPMRAEMLKAGAPVATGELEFMAQVAATFAID